MNFKRLLSALAVFGLFGLPSFASWGFEINPCQRVLVYNTYYLDSEVIRFWNLCRHADLISGVKNGKYLKGTVHEHMTNFAIDEYRGSGFLFSKPERPARDTSKLLRFNFMAEKQWAKSPATAKHKTFAIIYGSWWNDDPLMYTWGQGRDFKNGLFSLGSQFDAGSKKYAGGVKDCWLEAKDHLGWNSHFGKLQYLHFMSSQGAAVTEEARLDETTRLALVWIKFAYHVAVGAIPADTPLTRQTEEGLGLPSVALNYCLGNAANAKVRTLFARVDMQDEKERNERTPDVALGSIFHILQDSFSPAHTCRQEQVVEGQHFAVLTKVYNFNDQVNELHGERAHQVNDKYPGWLLTYARNAEHVYGNDPIAVGAWLIRAVDAKTPWGEVESHLRQTIFKKRTGTAPDNAPCMGKRNVTGLI